MIAHPWLSWRTLPLRVRLTVVFAVVIGVVLALTGLVVYVQFRQSIDARTDDELADRQVTLVALVRSDSDPEHVVQQAGESLLQIYAPGGRVLASSRMLRTGRLIEPAVVERVRGAALTLTRGNLPGLDDGARVRAFGVPGGRVAAIGEARDDRERALHRLAAILIITLPGALILACLAGYRVASAALQPVESMRARAAEIGAGSPGELLPEPGTRDELDRLARTLNHLLTRLQQAVEHERRIVSDASHELRTPVSVLLTRLDVALRQDLDRDELIRVVRDARGDARRLSRLADDLLLLARADQGRLPLRIEAVEVHDLLDAARTRHAAQAAPSRRVLVVGEVKGGAVVLADPIRTAQVLDNLIANALRHGAGDVELRSSEHQGRIAISVRDHGPGYPDEFLPRAFERFSQADATGDGPGAGLGLSIAEAVVRAQGGTIAVANAADGGAVVTVRLPPA
ncbi:MAG TPA: HAMP domain-containing sensor histidine kinase [Miltoncostaeaceae bacterium]|nr:HAMP domain-containing sensor histidine kinase [Miltoncostaeaceae bacterium]